MFIDSTLTYDWLRSKERKATKLFQSSITLLLRTEPQVDCTGFYKHLTPTG